MQVISENKSKKRGNPWIPYNIDIVLVTYYSKLLYISRYILNLSHHFANHNQIVT